VSAGGLRASDADRDSVVNLLHTAYAEGRITSDEHTERVQATISAKTLDDLVPLTADLVPAAPAEPLVPRGPRAVPVPAGGAGETDRMTAALSTVKRGGPWRVRPRVFANIFLGSVELDLTEATFDVQVVELNITQFMGSVFLRVPWGTTIRDETSHALGETSIKGIGSPDPSFPVIVLRGTNVLGEIKVRGPKRPPVWKRALA
jgi:hypothetical protein